MYDELVLSQFIFDQGIYYGIYNGNIYKIKLSIPKIE